MVDGGVLELELFDVVERCARREGQRLLVEGNAPHLVPAGVAVEVAGEVIAGEDGEHLLVLALSEDRAQDVQLDAVLDQVAEVERVVRLLLGALTGEYGIDAGDLEEDHEAAADTSDEVEREDQAAADRRLVEDVGVLPELITLRPVRDADPEGGHDQVTLGQGLEEALQLLDVLGLEAVGVHGGLLGLGGGRLRSAQFGLGRLVEVADLRIVLVAATKLLGHVMSFRFSRSVSLPIANGYRHTSLFWMNR